MCRGELRAGEDQERWRLMLRSSAFVVDGGKGGGCDKSPCVFAGTLLPSVMHLSSR
jgi:hypothetical protein